MSLLTLLWSLLHMTRLAMRFLAKKPRVAFGLPYPLIELFYIGMPVVRTDGRTDGWTYGYVTTSHFQKFSDV